jgi:hypothetical protein
LPAPFPSLGGVIQLRGIQCPAESLSGYGVFRSPEQLHSNEE